MIIHIEHDLLDDAREAISDSINRMLNARAGHYDERRAENLTTMHNYLTEIMDRQQETYKVVILKPEVTR